MNPATRGTEVLLAAIETDAEHPRTHGGPCIMWPLVLALGHEGLLGRGERRAREEEHSARHRALTQNSRCPQAGSRDTVKNRRDRRVAAVACGHSVGGQPSQATIGHAHVDSVEP